MKKRNFVMIARAYQLGCAAFHDGKPNTPVLDSNLMKFMKEFTNFDANYTTLNILDSWSKGWINESLKNRQ